MEFIILLGIRAIGRKNLIMSIHIILQIMCFGKSAFCKKMADQYLGKEKNQRNFVQCC